MYIAEIKAWYMYLTCSKDGTVIKVHGYYSCSDNQFPFLHQHKLWQMLPYQIQVTEEYPTGFILLNLLRSPDAYARHPLQTLRCYLDYAELAQTATKNASLHTHKPETNLNTATKLFEEFWILGRGEKKEKKKKKTHTHTVYINL